MKLIVFKVVFERHIVLLVGVYLEYILRLTCLVKNRGVGFKNA